MIQASSQSNLQSINPSPSWSTSLNTMTIPIIPIKLTKQSKSCWFQSWSSLLHWHCPACHLQGFEEVFEKGLCFKDHLTLSLVLQLVYIDLHRFTSLHRIDNEQTHNLRSLPHGWGGEPGVVNVRGEGQMVVDTLDNIDFNWIKISRVFNILDRAGRLDGSWHSTGCHSLVVLWSSQDILIWFKIKIFLKYCDS